VLVFMHYAVSLLSAGVRCSSIFRTGRIANWDPLFRQDWLSCHEGICCVDDLKAINLANQAPVLAAKKSVAAHAAELPSA